MTEWRGTVAGETLGDRLQLLAGILAEEGITTVSIEVPGQPARDWPARETDLPGRLGAGLERHGSCTLRARSGRIEVEVHPDRIAWRTTDAGLAAALRRPTLLG